MKRNPHFARLQKNYLFPEIQLRKQAFLEKHPLVSLLNLGIGDTTQPIPSSIASALASSAAGLCTHEAYSGYGPEQGHLTLREKIAQVIYNHQIHPQDIFISDGAKCDLGRLQTLFGSQVSIAVQDPTYPVYIEGSVLQGVNDIVLMPCTPENDFFPDLNLLKRTDLIYFCSPNNPTGAVATRKQLEELVAFAKANHSIILFDAAYSPYIQDPSLPQSIYEIPGAKEVAIEIHSFSKLAGFTGVRLGWCVIPQELQYEDGQSIRNDWNRLTTTLFNGASNIAQAGGVAVLEPQGLKESGLMTRYYLENGQILKKAFEGMNCQVFGGIHAPYLWVYFQEKNSWDLFQHFLETYHIVTTPGSGFGPSGEGFIRLTSFGSRNNILEAVKRLA